MKKFLSIIVILVVTTQLTYAAGDFFRFSNPMLNNNSYWNATEREINSSIEEMRNQNWSNPYDIYNNPTAKMFRKNDTHKNSVKDSDIEYLLSKMEKNSFGRNYNTLDIDSRLDRLEAQMFGAIQCGDYKNRLNRLKQAYSAESTRNYKVKEKKINKFKEFFSTGYPTSIPAREDYYSSLRNGLY